jgi:ABC-type Fe3+-hydroxamate transport system substrate-binding protein
LEHPIPTAYDDLDEPVDLVRPVRRVVSLVPSLTESVASLDPGLIVGATDWCTHPADLQTTRVRGTKNPDVAKIIALRPDLVLANKEENRRTDVERLRAAGVPVWVTVIETVAEALDSLDRIFTVALDVDLPAWLVDARAAWSRPAPAISRDVAIAIWRDPWMVVGPGTFTGDLAQRLGWRNVFDDPAQTERYPHTTVAEIIERSPSLVVLPDEPYVFTATDGPEAFPDVQTLLVSGRLLTWYGPSLATARDYLTNAGS